MPVAVPIDAPEVDCFVPSADKVSIAGADFVDQHGRVLSLRGANVGSASKTPMRPCPPFHDHRKSTYVGRPFPLEEADEQWQRLKSWGMSFVRINVTWEALEHAGPGQYDQEYLNYLRKLLIKMHENGVAGYVVIHQDVFSRYCGGSGAPGWVVEAAGFDLSDDGESMALSGSAFLDGLRGGRLQGERGLWPTGYQKLACATMNTLFWAGETFAPSFKVEGSDGKPISIQTYLQDAFLAAYDKLVEAVGDLPGVLGFEMLNEPHPGYIGLTSTHEWNYNTDLHLGQFPSPLQSFSMGAGHPTRDVPIYVRSFPWPTRVSRSITANPGAACVWRQDGPTAGKCPFEREGVWKWHEAKKAPVALQEDYFAKDRNGKRVDFYNDFVYPFVKRWEAVVDQRAKGKARLRLVEAVPNEYAPEWPLDKRPGNFVYAPHWYDLNAMFKKQFGFMTVNVQGLSRGMFFAKALYFGGKAAKKNYALQIKTLVREARKTLGDVPIVFGECGIPMDINKEEAFRTGDFSAHETMMDALISALEASSVGYNIWAFNPQNDDLVGDDWNAEHFSWYSNGRRDLELAQRGIDPKSREAKADLDAGARLLDVMVRPYAIATAGTQPISTFDADTSAFTLRFRSSLRITSHGQEEEVPSMADLTEVFLPKRHYTEANTSWTVSPGGRVLFQWEKQRAWVWFADQLPSTKSEKEALDKPRRFDVWVPGKKAKSRGGWATSRPAQVVLALLLLVLGLSVTYLAQMAEWENERRMGLRK